MMNITISLPIDDRQTAHAFYSRALGLETRGEPDTDGLPEPLQFELNPQTKLMLVPRGGFEWVIGAERMAPTGKNEVLLGIPVATEQAVRQTFESCLAEGGAAVSEPSKKPWGFEAMFADPDGHVWTLYLENDN